MDPNLQSPQRQSRFRSQRYDTPPRPGLGIGRRSLVYPGICRSVHPPRPGVIGCAAHCPTAPPPIVGRSLSAASRKPLAPPDQKAVNHIAKLAMKRLTETKDMTSRAREFIGLLLLIPFCFSYVLFLFRRQHPMADQLPSLDTPAASSMVTCARLGTAREQLAVRAASLISVYKP